MALKSTLTFRKIEMVEAVAKTGSVSAAAEMLGLSQPALTLGLQSIEKQLSVKLFTRTPRGLEPTPFAEPFLAHIETIRAAMQATKQELRAGKTVPPRRLVVQTGPRSAELWVKPAIEALSDEGHNIVIEIISMFDSVYENLINGGVDLVIAPAGAIPRHDALVFKPFAAVRNRIVCRAGHPLTLINRPSFADLRAYPLCGDVIPPRYLNGFDGKLGQFATLDPERGKFFAALRESDLEKVYAKLKASHAVGLLPKELFKDLPAEYGLVLLNDSECRLPDLPVAIGYHKSRADDPDIARFVEHLRSAELNHAHFFVDYDT